MARIIRAWRDLTAADGRRHVPRGGPPGRTLVACSGGADSCALLIALAAATDQLVVGHVVHDLRPRDQALADADSIRELAGHLGLAVEQAEVRVHKRTGDDAVEKTRENLEARARRLRYAALGTMAAAHGCRFIATAHHAEDHLETVLMALIRGAGPRGLAGVPVERPLNRTPGAPRVIRPLLGDRHGQLEAVSRAELQEICRVAGWQWREDATNADTGLLRNALRHEVLPVLERLRPGAAVRAARSGRAVRAAARALEAAAGQLRDAANVAADAREWSWPRNRLRRQPAALLFELLRSLERDALPKDTGADRLSRRALAPLVRAILDDSTEPRRFSAGRMSVHVTGRAVRVRAGVPSAHDHVDHPVDS